MADYPDWTDLVQIIGSDIMVPIDIQGSYIMLPVDIQAQYVTLEIDIVAQSVGNIAIDIAAQSIGNLNVNIAASAVTMNVAVSGTANINITAQTVALANQAEWAAQKGAGVNKTAFGEEVATGGNAYTSHTVATGKTLYICGLSFYIFATAPADGDKNQIGYAYLRNHTDNKELAYIGGNGGGGITFPKPIELVAGKVLRAYVVNWSNHVCDIGVSTWGYEL